MPSENGFIRLLLLPQRPGVCEEHWNGKRSALVAKCFSCFMSWRCCRYIYYSGCILDTYVLITQMMLSPQHYWWCRANHITEQPCWDQERLHWPVLSFKCSGVHCCPGTEIKRFHCPYPPHRQAHCSWLSDWSDISARAQATSPPMRSKTLDVNNFKTAQSFWQWWIESLRLRSQQLALSFCRWLLQSCHHTGEHCTRSSEKGVWRWHSFHALQEIIVYAA